MNRILIGGRGRSGTTIMKRVLRRHPDIVGIQAELRIHIIKGGLMDVVND